MSTDKKHYQALMIDHKRRQERNVRLLARLENIEKKAAFLQAKTDRIKSLKSIYKNQVNKPSLPTRNVNVYYNNPNNRILAERVPVNIASSIYDFNQYDPLQYSNYRYERLYREPNPLYTLKPITLDDAIEEISKRFILVPKQAENDEDDDKEKTNFYPHSFMRDDDDRYYSDENEFYPKKHHKTIPEESSESRRTTTPFSPKETDVKESGNVKKEALKDNDPGESFDLLNKNYDRHAQEIIDTVPISNEDVILDDTKDDNNEKIQNNNENIKEYNKPENVEMLLEVEKLDSSEIQDQNIVLKTNEQINISEDITNVERKSEECGPKEDKLSNETKDKDNIKNSSEIPTVDESKIEDIYDKDKIEHPDENQLQQNPGIEETQNKNENYQVDQKLTANEEIYDGNYAQSENKNDNHANEQQAEIIQNQEPYPEGYDINQQETKYDENVEQQPYYNPDEQNYTSEEFPTNQQMYTENNEGDANQQVTQENQDYNADQQYYYNENGEIAEQYQYDQNYVDPNAENQNNDYYTDQQYNNGESNITQDQVPEQTDQNEYYANQQEGLATEAPYYDETQQNQEATNQYYDGQDTANNENEYVQETQENIYTDETSANINQEQTIVEVDQTQYPQDNTVYEQDQNQHENQSSDIPQDNPEEQEVKPLKILESDTDYEVSNKEESTKQDSDFDFSVAQ